MPGFAKTENQLRMQVVFYPKVVFALAYIFRCFFTNLMKYI